MPFRSSKNRAVTGLRVEFSGGLNLADPPTALQDNQLAQAVNVYYPPGETSLATRPGLLHAALPATVSGADAPILKLHYYVKDASHDYLLAAMADGNLYRQEDASGTAVWRLLGALTTPGVSPSFLTFGGVCLVADGGPELKRFDGTDYEAIPGSPAGATALAETAGRVAANSASDPDAVIFSAPEDETEWSLVGGAVMIRAGYRDALSVTGFGMLGGDLMVFKGGTAGKMIYRVSASGSTANWSLAPLSRNTTAASPQAICAVGNNLFFADSTGILDLAGTMEYGDIKVGIAGRPVNCLLNLKPVREMTYLAGLAAMLVLIEGDPAVLVYHPVMGAWTSLNFQDIRISSVCQAGDEVFLAGGNGHLYRLSAAEDKDEVAPGERRDIAAAARTKTFDMPGQALVKSVRLYAETLSGGYGELAVVGRDQLNRSVVLSWTPVFGPGLLHDADGPLHDANEKLAAASLDYAGARTRLRDQAFSFQVKTGSGRIKMRHLEATLAEIGA
jgi:hypothetical protein